MENKFTWQEKILRLKKIEFSVWIINTVCLKVKNKNKAALENFFFLLASSPLALLSLFIILLNIISSFTFFILYCSKSEKLYIQELRKKISLQTRGGAHWLCDLILRPRCSSLRVLTPSSGHRVTSLTVLLHPAPALSMTQ